MKAKTRKIALAALSVTMAATLTAGQLIAYANENRYIAPTSGETVVEGTFNNLTGSIDLSEIARNNLSESVVDYGDEVATQTITGNNSTETLIISLETPSVMDVKGDDLSVAEFLSTSVGKRALDEIEASQNKLLRQLSSAGISYKEVSRYSTVLNAVAIEVNTVQFKKISSLSGVGMVGVSKTYQAMSMPDAQYNYSKVYGTGIYDSSEIMAKYGYDGSGVTVAILDTGLDYTHEAFSYDPEVVSFTEDYVSEIVSAGKLHATQRSPGATVNDLYLSAKVPFAYDYSDNDTDVYPSYSQHGVHVAGIVAGKADTYIDKDGNQVGEEDDGIMDFLGAAPEAQLVICKVFTDDLDSIDLGGATSEDLIAALDDCVTLGVDIINMSLGTTSGFSNLDIEGDAEAYQLKTVYEKIKKAGISLIAAAGNEFSAGYGSEFGTNLGSNPDSGTVGSPSTFIGSMSVASVNGLEAPFMLANPDENSKYGSTPVYYNESNDANAVPFEFAEELLGDKESETFTYVVIPGVGQLGDYSSAKSIIAQKHAAGERVIAVVKRGKINFKEKIEYAQASGADAIIVYNNVPGTIRMSLGEIDESKRIPSVSVNMDAGTALTTDPNNSLRLRTTGTIEINKTYTAGPFMNDYSSWGATPDLKLKPDITSHGGEITSAVSGGYEQMSGTSMATPNLAGLMALVKNYLKNTHEGITAQQLTTLTNQIVMSSATLLYDEESLPYSPRKQGAGLATLKNIFTTNAYLSTIEGKNGGTEDNRPKIELGEDEKKTGVYEFTFYVTNFGTSDLSFKLKSQFFTESISSDGLAVAEAAYMLNDCPVEFKVNNAAKKAGDTITVSGGATSTIDVKITLSDSARAYIDKNFVNGMYVEGFITLESPTANDDEGQCDLNIPFMGFYGDWEAAPLLDYNAYEIAEIQQDTSMDENEKPHESAFATQLFSTYYNGKYAVPMGGYAYLQDENAQQVYVTEEHCSVSRFNIYNGATAMDNYMTSTGIRALYAGLLRNAELVTYDIYNAYTGEIIRQGEKYRIGKSYANGGSNVPALVDLKLDVEELGLENNGKYTIEFNFYMKAVDKDNGTTNSNNTFKTDFYADFDSPILEATRLRYYDYTVNKEKRQKVYLELDIYDNHYPQSVLLCYSEDDYDPDSEEVAVINMATEYVTPVYNAGRNTTTTVTIEITDIYEKYQNKLYVQIDDYALNHTVYNLAFNQANANNQADDFNFVENDRVTRTRNIFGEYEYNLTLEVNELYTVALDCGTSNPSNYTWDTNFSNYFKVHNNELFGVSPVAPGEAYLTVTNGKAGSDYKAIRLNVAVVDSSRKLPMPTLSFGAMVNSSLSLVKPTSSVDVNAGQTFQLTVEADYWYYPLDTLTFNWSSSKPEIATVDEKGVVTTNNTKGSTIITAETQLNDGPNGTPGTKVSAVVTLYVQEPYKISSMQLTKYYGSEEHVVLPNDENIMYIGEEAFKDNTTMKSIVIPRTVTEIAERAFLNCTALEEVYFIQKTGDDEGYDPVLDLAKLNLILRDAFMGCTNLKLLDLTNVKVATIGASAFENCTSLEEIRYMEKIGIAGDYAFSGCTSLKDADITGLHTSGDNVFEGCTDLTSVITAHYTAMGAGMFYGCTSLKEVTINNPNVAGSARINFGPIGFFGGAFENCTALETVNFGSDLAGTNWSNTVFSIQPYAFAGCTNLTTVNFNNYRVSLIGDYAFAETAITSFKMPEGNPVLGESIFNGKHVDIDWGTGYTTDASGAVYVGTTLVRAPETIDSTFAIRTDTTEIAPYAFTDSKFEGVTTVIIPDSVTIIGEGAFSGTPITSINIPANITVIPDYSFAGSKLTAIEIPANVTSIGESAFEGCRDLAEITFANSSKLATIGNYAFSGTAIISITLPASVETMGNYTFANCSQLSEVTILAVKSLGAYTFLNCLELTTVNFDEGAEDSGTYTFFPGIERYERDGTPVYKVSKLATVDLGRLTTIGDGAFWRCVSLTSVDLKNVTEVGAFAFAECLALTTITGLEKLTEIGNDAFALTALTTLNLAKAVNIGDEAFYLVPAVSLSIPVAETIGEFAFAGIDISSLNIPATLKSLGKAAFVQAEYLSTVTVDSGNKIFFANNNVLYRNIISFKEGATGTYELCLYPANLRGTSSGGLSPTYYYTIIDGTVSIQAYAVAYINSGMLNTVTMPYSLKVIGAFAFYGTNISKYRFESINAPTLISEYRDIVVVTSSGEQSVRTLYYANFYDEFVDYYLAAKTWERVIEIPSNGVGYDNYVFSHYFGDRIEIGELKDDNTRQLISMIDSFDIETVKSWLTLEVNDANKAMVNAFSEKVKEAHRIYNNTRSEVQLGFLNEGDDREAKLFAIEEALKPVKARFGIKVNVASLRVDSSSTYKKEYKEGEYFDMTGLVLAVTYDDYSTGIITDLSEVTLLPDYTDALGFYTEYVEVTYGGAYCRVLITVTRDTDGEGGNTGTPGGDETPGGNCSGCGSMDIGSTLGGMGLMLLTLAGMLLVVQKLRRKANNR